MRRNRLIVGCIGVLLQLATVCEVFAADASLNIFWSIPMPRREYPVAEFVVWKASVDRQGFVAALVWNGNRYLLLLDPKEQQPAPVELALKGDPIIVRIAHGTDNSLWLAGRANRRSYGPGRDVADPYLAKVDRTGRVTAEYTFNARTFQQFKALNSLPSGNVLVVRQDESEAWVESVSPRGRLLWQSRVPVATNRDIELAVLGERVLVAGIEEVRLDKTKYRADAVIWIYDSAGVPVDRQLLRQGLSYRETTGVKTQRAGNAVYVLTSSEDLGVRTPIEVLKVSSDGKVRWRTEIPENIVQQPDKRSLSCQPGYTVIENNDLLIACALGTRILLVRVAANDGKATHAYTPLPDCHGGLSATLFPLRRSNGALWLIGTRPIGAVVPACTWLGSVSLPW